MAGQAIQVPLGGKAGPVVADRRFPWRIVATGADIGNLQADIGMRPASMAIGANDSRPPGGGVAGEAFGILLSLTPFLPEIP